MEVLHPDDSDGLLFAVTSFLDVASARFPSDSVPKMFFKALRLSAQERIQLGLERVRRERDDKQSDEEFSASVNTFVDAIAADVGQKARRGLRRFAQTNRYGREAEALLLSHWRILEACGAYEEVGLLPDPPAGETPEAEVRRRLFGTSLGDLTVSLGPDDFVGLVGVVRLLLRGERPAAVDFVARCMQPALVELLQLRRSNVIVRYTFWRDTVARMIGVRIDEKTVPRDDDGQVKDGSLQRLLGVRLGLWQDEAGAWVPAETCLARPCSGGPSGRWCGRPSIVVARDETGLEWFSCPLHTEGRMVFFIREHLGRMPEGDPYHQHDPLQRLLELRTRLMSLNQPTPVVESIFEHVQPLLEELEQLRREVAMLREEREVARGSTT